MIATANQIAKPRNWPAAITARTAYPASANAASRASRCSGLAPYQCRIRLVMVLPRVVTPVTPASGK